MESSGSNSFLRIHGPQPVAELLQEAELLVHTREGSGGASSASLFSQLASKSTAFAGPAKDLHQSSIPRRHANSSYQHSQFSTHDNHLQFSSTDLRLESSHGHLHSPSTSGLHIVPNSLLHHPSICRRPFRGARPRSDHAFNSASTPTHRLPDDWTQWVELGLRISRLPASTTTSDLYQCFRTRGNVVFIELYENTRNERQGTACVRFRYVVSYNVAMNNSGNLNS